MKTVILLSPRFCQLKKIRMITPKLLNILMKATFIALLRRLSLTKITAKAMGMVITFARFAFVVFAVLLLVISSVLVTDKRELSGILSRKRIYPSLPMDLSPTSLSIPTLSPAV